jgi:RNA polymerase sigma-70 factor (ECF subfamily)
LQWKFHVSTSHSAQHHEHPSAAGFASTQWSLVLAAGQPGEPQSQAALEELCRRYWVPLYAYARRRTRDVHEAQDAVQGFFSHLLEKNTVAVAEPERGRFRSFLLTAFRHFLANEHAKHSTRKRGGGKSVLSLDFDLGESRFRHEPVDRMTAERLYDRQWIATLLEGVLNQLREAMARAGKKRQFETLVPFLSGNHDEGAYTKAATRLGITEGAAMVAVHRLRGRYRRMLQAEIARTLSDPGEVEDEIRHLFNCLRD